MITKSKIKRNFNKRKGFTLIELLAVIVILAVIALIATPLILNLVNDARKSAAKDSAYGYIKAIENKVALSALENKTYEDKEGYVYDEIEANVKGNRPTGGLYTLRKGIIIEGTFCIDGFVVEYENGQAKVVDKGCNEESLKLNGSIKLSSNSGNYTYPETGEFKVIENISGGTLNCETDDSSVATCSIKDNIITVKPGTKEGSATLTITSASTSKYKEAKAAYVASTTPGLLSVTANGYNGIYDGEEHGITVKVENAIIKYGEEEGTYNLEESPKYTDVGEYTVYYEITKAGYKPVTGKKNVVITKAEGKIVLEASKGTVAYKEIKEVEIVENVSNGEIEVEIANPSVLEVSVKNNKIVIKGKEIGATTITVTSKETHNYNSKSTQYNIEVIKANNTLKLSSTSGNYTYPETGTIEVIENTSGGSLSCTTSNSKVATCTISGNIITVVPGKTEGSATLTIKSKETTNYNEAQVAYLVITAKGTLTSYTANEYTGVYDGNSHGITVTSENSTITYSTDGTNYSSENPKYKDVGEYTVYFKIEKEGYNDIESSKKVVITKAEGSVIAPTAKTLTYNGNSKTLINAGSTTTGTIQYKLGNGTYSEELPNATNAGTYTVYYKVVGDSNHNDVKEESISVTIKKATLNYTSGGYSGAYDGSSHGITVISEGATIKYGETQGTYNLDVSPTLTDVGTKTVYFKITRDNYIDVTGSEKIEVTKANNTLKLSSTSGNYTYPETGTIEVIENTSGGSLSCTTSNSKVATCSISGNIVTVVPGKTEGNATLTIKSKETTNYNEAQAAYLVITAKGTLTSYTANGYTGVYDGKEHGITVESSGATITYSKDGTNYSSENPKYINVGKYTVYYKIEKEGYNDVKKSETVTITPTTPSVVYNGGANSCSWKNNYNISLVSGNNIGIDHFDIDWTGDGIADLTTGANFIPGNGFHTCSARFRAVSTAGHVSGWTDVQHIHMDTQAPGTPNVTYNGGSNTCSWKNNYNLTLSASDNVGVDHYEIDWTGDGNANTTTGANFIPWNGFNACSVRFRAVDHAGNVGPWTSGNHIHMDTQAPSTPSVSLNGYSSGSWTNGNVTQTASASDNVGVSYYQYSHDGYNVAGTFPNPWTINWDGQWNFYVRAVDHAGNISGWSSMYTIRRDATAPSITSVGIAGRDGANKTATLSYSATDGATGLSSVICYYGIGNYNSSVAGTATSCTMTGLAPGNVYNYNIVARDGLGNQSNVTGTLVADGWYSDNPNASIPTWFYYSNGSRATGRINNIPWKNKLTSDYYLDPSTGTLVRGWILIGGNWYYAIHKKYTYFEASDSDNNSSLIPDGSLAKNRWLCIPYDNAYHSSTYNGQYYWYHFNANGVYDQKGSSCWAGTVGHM